MRERRAKRACADAGRGLRARRARHAARAPADRSPRSTIAGYVVGHARARAPRAVAASVSTPMGTTTIAANATTIAARLQMAARQARARAEGALNACLFPAFWASARSDAGDHASQLTSMSVSGSPSALAPCSVASTSMAPKHSRHLSKSPSAMTLVVSIGVPASTSSSRP